MEARVHHGHRDNGRADERCRPTPGIKCGRRSRPPRGGFGSPPTRRSVSCYEAGRDGFWIHRYLTSLGVENLVVDSSSIEVNRRARRAKTDRMDVEKLLAMLLRYVGGERRSGGLCACRARPTSNVGSCIGSCSR